MGHFFLQKIKENYKSGFNVALISIPLAVSLAVASNSTPIVGIITAIWAGLIASFLGGSNYNIIGPTGALSGILAGYAIMYGPGALSIMAIIAGLFILLAYFLKLEEYIVFFPSSSIHGFTLGICFIIALNQINYALGLKNIPVHEKFILNVIESFKNINNIDIFTFIIFIIFFSLLFLLTKLIPKIPAMILLSPVAIFIGYLSSRNFLFFNVQTLETRFGNISAQLFLPIKFVFSSKMILASVAIAIIAIIETMISARIADGLTRTKHDKRKEMLGLGLANIGSGLFGGIPATAALARTATNIKSGATNKMSATISSILILIISIFFLSYFKYMPLAAIAAMLVYISIKMIEKENFIRMFKIDKKNFYLSMLVAIITVYEDPIVGILFGATIAMLYLMKSLSQGHFDLETRAIKVGNLEQVSSIDQHEADTLVYSIKGKLAYINSYSHITRFESKPIEYTNVLIDLEDLFFIDLDGIEALEEIIYILKKQNKIVLISGVRPFVEQMLNSTESFKKLKELGLVFENVDQAINFLTHGKLIKLER